MKKVAVFCFSKSVIEELESLKIKQVPTMLCMHKYDLDDAESEKDLMGRFPRYFSDKEFLQDEKYFKETIEKILCFLWNQFKYQSKHSRKMSAVYFALLYNLESKQDHFDKEAFQLKIKTLYEQNLLGRNKIFSSFSEFQYDLFNDFSELGDFTKYFLLIIQRLETEIEKNLFVNACFYFVENFREMENVDFKISFKKNRI